MTLMDIDDVRDSLAPWPGGCREYVRTKATELCLGGYFIRPNGYKNARVVVEGPRANLSAFIDTMYELVGNHFISTIIHHSQVELSSRTHRDFEILQSSDKLCIKGLRSPVDYDFSSSTSSEDHEVSL